MAIRSTRVDALDCPQCAGSGLLEQVFEGRFQGVKSAVLLAAPEARRKNHQHKGQKDEINHCSPQSNELELEHESALL